MTSLSKRKGGKNIRGVLGISSAAILVVLSLSAGFAVPAQAGTSISKACIQFFSGKTGEYVGSPICRTSDQADGIHAATNGYVASYNPIIQRGCIPIIGFYGSSNQFLGSSCGPAIMTGFDVKWTSMMTAFSWDTYSIYRGNLKQSVAVPLYTHMAGIDIGGPIMSFAFMKNGIVVEKLAVPDGAVTDFQITVY